MRTISVCGLRSKNKLPTRELDADLQWQPKNDIVFTLGYVGNHGFTNNSSPVQPGADCNTAASTLVEVLSSKLFRMDTVCRELSRKNPQALTDGFAAGNASLRAPYIGYDPNSTYYKAVEFQATRLQFNVTSA